jgi:hypothetical protein
MKISLLVLIIFFHAAGFVFGQLYEWTDATGVVNFTDDPDRIPAKYRATVQEREGIKSTPPAADREKSMSSSSEEPSKGAPVLFAGKELTAWKSEYLVRSSEAEALRNQLVKLNEEMIVAKRKKLIYQRDMDRKALAAKQQEISDKEARLAEVEKALAELERSARSAGLPNDWRER